MSKITLQQSIRYFCNIAKTNKIKRIVCLEKEKFKIEQSKFPPKTKINLDTIVLLEWLSLVSCDKKEASEILEVKLEFADQILQVNTSNVNPMVMPIEDIPLRVREDIVNEGNCRGTILNGATLIEEEYFVLPPSNIHL